MKNYNFPYELEIDKIRATLYEESKAMTAEERVNKSNDLTHKLAKKYGFKVIPAKSLNNTEVLLP